ncbi:hypothetical protein IKO70_08970 [bacterium]|nr:hypothetical protein [bacterium]
MGFVYIFLSLKFFQLLWDKISEAYDIDWCWLPVAEVLYLLVIILGIMFLAWGCNQIFSEDKKSFSDLLEMLANKPDKSSYDWKGNYSIFNFILFWLIRGLRLVSALQFAKLIFRSPFKDQDANKNKERPDVPPLFQELYFTVWGILLIVQVSRGISSSFTCILNAYFLIESTTWILYYGVFRRFFEKKYKTYHELEHLPLILLTIPLQAVAYAACLMNINANTNITWCKVMPVLLGQAKENMIIPGIFGFLYSAIVISMVIRSFPDEKTKEEDD